MRLLASPALLLALILTPLSLFAATPAFAAETCNNGTDDDADGLADCADTTDCPATGVCGLDADRDGYGASSLGGSDCNDSSASVHPGASEYCNGSDDDCDGRADDSPVDGTTYYRDADSDGYGTSATTSVACSAPSGYVANRTDCDDTTSAINPGMAEFCDSRDNDCDGSVDEGTGTTYYRDSDGDTYGDPAVTSVSCTVPSGYVANAEDCLDSNATVNPRGTETCNDIDDDCNGIVDDTGGTYYYADTDGDGWGNPDDGTFLCRLTAGYAAIKGDCDDTNPAINSGATEICDGVDDDCDGSVDESGGTTWYRDADGDGYGNAAYTAIACTAPAGYAALSTDCNDSVSSVHPGATEVCNSVDDDCDGVVDDGAGTTYYADSDHDNYGNPVSYVTACSTPSGYVSNGSDCDDTHASVNPAQVETCDGLDNDCNGSVDDGIGSTWYRDSDGDGYGDHSVTTRNCSAPSGYVADYLDCNDTNSGVHPDATEFCNDVDDDCNGIVDDDAYDTSTWYQDADADGYGNSAVSSVACDAPAGYVGSGGDCLDEDPGVNPGATELADGVDQDCDDIVDEHTDWYDDDGDGYAEDGGDCNDNTGAISPVAEETCDSRDEDCDGVVDNGTECYDDDRDGTTEEEGDCNDGDAAVNPAATEDLENGIDDDCDGAVDSGVYDPDSDGYTRDGGDCAEGDNATYPGATEVQDGVDNDCDGTVDEDTDASDDDYDGVTEDAGDCDDGDDTIFPEADELDDGKDNDCDGMVDEGTDATDDDADGFSEEQGDCDDTDGSVNPEETESLDGADNNCNELVDEGLVDADADGFTTEQGDCEDNNGWIYPDAPESCDSLDNDCDGQIDNECDGVDTTFKSAGPCGCAVGADDASALGVAMMLGAALLRRRSR